MAPKVKFLLPTFGQNVTMAFDLLSSKSNRFVFVPGHQSCKFGSNSCKPFTIYYTHKDGHTDRYTDSW